MFFEWIFPRNQNHASLQLAIDFSRCTDFEWRAFAQASSIICQFNFTFNSTKHKKLLFTCSIDAILCLPLRLIISDVLSLPSPPPFSYASYEHAQLESSALFSPLFSCLFWMSCGGKIKTNAALCLPSRWFGCLSISGCRWCARRVPFPVDCVATGCDCWRKYVMQSLKFITEWQLTISPTKAHDTDFDCAFCAQTCRSRRAISWALVVRLSISAARLPTIENSLPTERRTTDCCASYSVYPAYSSGCFWCSRNSPSTLCSPDSKARRSMTSRCRKLMLSRFRSDLINIRCKCRRMRWAWCCIVVAFRPAVFVDVVRRPWPTSPCTLKPRTFRRESYLLIDWDKTLQWWSFKWDLREFISYD